MTTPLDAKLNELATQALAVHGLVLVQARLSGSSGRLTLQVFAEKPDGSGATLEQCTEASRTLSAQLDVADIISSRYVLEVGSPGLERPLVSAADCARFTGRHAKFRFAFAHKVQETGQEFGALTGTILGVEGEEVTLTVEKSAHATTFAFKNVREAHLAPTPEEIAAFMKESAAASKAKSLTGTND